MKLTRTVQARHVAEQVTRPRDPRRGQVDPQHQVLANSHVVGLIAGGYYATEGAAIAETEILRDITDRHRELTTGTSGPQLANLDHYYRLHLYEGYEAAQVGDMSVEEAHIEGLARFIHQSDLFYLDLPQALGGFPADLRRDGTLVDPTGVSRKGTELVSETVVTADAATGSGAEVRSGGCLCGKIRFTVTGPADDPHVCNCAHCATRSGAPFQWWVGFPTDGLKWTGDGQPTWFDTYPGKTARGFCGTCGTHLAARDYDGTMIGFLATALDDYGTDPALVPTNLNRVAEAAPWLAHCATRPAAAS